MNYYYNLRKFIRAVNIEYERRIRTASQIRQYSYESNDFALNKLYQDELEMNNQHKANWTEGLANKIGYFLSSFTYIVVTLCVYTFLSIMTWVTLLWNLSPEYGKASLIAYGVATGGDPLDFADMLNNHPLIWAWLLILHVLSWLVVPVLAATAVDAAYKVVEQRRARAKRELSDQIEQVGEEIGLSAESIKKVFDAVEKYQAKKH